MLPIGSIVFLLRVAPIKIANNFKGHYIEKPPNLNFTKCQCFKIANLLSVLQYNVPYHELTLGNRVCLTIIYHKINPGNRVSLTMT